MVVIGGDLKKQFTHGAIANVNTSHNGKNLRKKVKTMVESAYLKHPIFSEDETHLYEAGFPTENVRFSTRYDLWSVIDFCTIISEVEENRNGWIKRTDYSCIIALFENQTFGDMTDYVLAYYDVFSGDNVWKEIDGTYDDIRQALIDNGIVQG